MSARRIDWLVGLLAPLACVAPEPARPASTPEPPRAIASVPTIAPMVAEDPIDPAGEATAEPMPPLDPFPDRSTVTVDELVAAIDALADEIATAETIRADYEDLIERKGLLDSPELFRDYVRIKIAFEATRDGGFWHLGWRITNKSPNSDEIWKQWSKLDSIDDAATHPSAWAECDELSALFAFFARKLGVHGVGLFWPTWNHVVAVWTIPGVQTVGGTSVRIIVPTSQIFLTQDDSLGTDGFNPWKQKTIYEYRRRDVRGEHRIDAELARFFVRQIAKHGRTGQNDLQSGRNARAAKLH